MVCLFGCVCWVCLLGVFVGGAGVGVACGDLTVSLAPWQESWGFFVADGEPSLYCEVFFGEGKGLDCGLASLCLLTHKDIMFKTYP
jgi:hypothetical protein